MGPEDPQLAPPAPRPTAAPISGLPRSGTTAFRGQTLAPPAFDPDWKDEPKPSLGDVLFASVRNTLVNQSTNSDEEALDRAYQGLIEKAKAAGISLPANPVRQKMYRIPGAIDVPADAFIADWHEKVAKLEQDNPDVAAKLGPLTRETLGGMADQLSRDAQVRYNELKQQRGEGFWSLDTLAEFGVNMGASMNDPVQRDTALMGMGGSKTVVGAVVRGAIENAAQDAATEPFIQSRQLRIGNVKDWQEALGDAASNMTLSALLGGGLSGGGKALEKAFTGAPGAGRADASLEDIVPAASLDEERFQRGQTAMRELAALYDETDPDAAAVIRRGEAEREKEWATAQQMPEGMERDTFVTAIESADDQIRRLREFMDEPAPARPDPPEGRLDISDDGPTPKIGEHLTEDGKPVTFQSFDPRQLQVAPDEFQYKRFKGEEGVNGAIADVEQWHAPSSGKILVFERANGEMVIADGHQRRAKALGLMDAGRGDIKLDGYLYREADGWTPSDLRLKGAQKNIREGRSDVLDTAQALRERPDAIDNSFPLSRSNIRQARQIARLSDDAWDLTRAGVLEPSHAALIGQVAPDRPEIHGPLARTLVEAAPENVRQAENILSEALLDYAERDAANQPSLFGDDNLGRAVMYRERAQIMDAAYAWLRSERSVFKALVDKGDIARALGNELVDAANLTAKDQVELAMAAIMHSRKAGVRTAVSDIITRALDSVRREGVTPTRAGQEVAREIRVLVEARGFKGLMEAEGPAPPQMAEAGPLFDGPGSPAHIEHADMLEGDLRPEGREDPGVKLADAVKQPDELTSMVEELKTAGQGGGERTPDQVLNDIRKLLDPKKQEKGAQAKPADPLKQAEEELAGLEKAESQLRDTLLGLTDAQKVSLVKMQYPDAYPWLNRLEGAELDDAIVGRVMAGDIKFARSGPLLVLSSGTLDLPKANRVFSPGQPDDLGFITSAEKALANPPARFKDAKTLTADQWRKLMREGGAKNEAFTYQIEPALARLADEGLTGDIPKTKFEEALARERKTLEKGELGYSDADRDYSAYVAPGPAKNYRQEVLTLPSLDYYSHNWASKGAIGHIRTTERQLPGGGKALHVEELQSDLHQEGAKLGYRDDAKLRNHIDVQEKARASYTSAVERYNRWLDAQDKWKAHPGQPTNTSSLDRNLAMISDPVGKELYREAAAAGDALRQSERMGPISNAPPRAPMENWEEPFVRHVLQRAAQEGYDTVTFPTWETLHAALQNAGTKQFYNGRLPNTLKRVAKSLGLKVEMVRAPLSDIDVATAKSMLARYQKELAEAQALPPLANPNIRDNRAALISSREAFVAKWQRVLDEAKNGNPVPAIRLTPEAKAKIQRDGVVMYSRGELGVGTSVEAVVERVRREFGDGASALMRIGELNISQTPPKWMAPDVQGVTDSQGRVTLFASNVAPEHVRGLMLHEVGVHAGLEGVLGQEGKAQLLDQLMRRLGEGDETVVNARKRVPDDTDPQHVAEETLAYLVQHAPKHTIVQRLIADVRAWLYKTFPSFRKWITLTDADMQSLAIGAVRQRIREAGWSTPSAVTRSGAAYFEPIRYARGRSDTPETAHAFHSPVLAPTENKIVEMAINGISTTDIAVEMGIQASSVRAVLSRAKKKLADAGTPVTIEKGAMGRSSEGRAPGEMRIAATSLFEQGLEAPVVLERLRAQGFPTNIETVYVYQSNWRAAKRAVENSTGPVKYARPPRDENGGTQGEGGGAVPSGDGGSPGAGGDVGGGGGPDLSGAAGSGAGESGVRLQRVTPADAVPDAPKIVNGKVVLTDAERAARKQAWKSFVDEAVVERRSHVFNTDWRFQNGERIVGKVARVESLHYHFQPDATYHESWLTHLAPDMTFLKAEVHGAEGTIHDTYSAEELRSTGLGQKLYRQAIDDMLERGVVANSDVEMSQAAIDLWKGLAKYGYDVVQRVTDLERLPNGRFTARLDGDAEGQPALFFVSRKKPPAPDLPEPDRDLQNRIDEARDLAEHMASCVPGKKGKR